MSLRSNHRAGYPAGLQNLVWLLVMTVLVVNLTGCAIRNEKQLRNVARVVSIGVPATAKVKKVKQPMKLGMLGRVVVKSPQPSERTQQLLRRYNLLDKYQQDPEYVVRWMQDICHTTPRMEEVHALAEIALIRGEWLERTGQDQKAQEMLAIAMVHAYQFLFDPTLDIQRNAYDPQFRSICDIYNQSLEGILRDICLKEGLDDGAHFRIENEKMAFDLHVKLKGRWKSNPFKKIELANDYEMQGIENLYHTYGLGVPLIAVRGTKDGEPLQGASEEYYPPNLTMPMTAFCRVNTAVDAPTESASKTRTAVLEVYDPLDQTNLMVDGRNVPLESDITTPLAYHLNDPLLNTGVLETMSMINANVVADMYGFYLLEPFDPDKIPVVMVHGLWSGPMTWLEMFNDLRSIRELSSNYQFWFYSYPTGQPFWDSARQMREDLVELRQKLDPYNASTALDQMVLVGHSMGGLVSRLQTIDSEGEFWNLVSDTDLDDWQGDPEALEELRRTFFFESSPAVKRVVTLATPHKGSRLANNLTRWASEKVFVLPDLIANEFNQLARQNSDLLRSRELLTTKTSIDSLSPDCQFIQVLHSKPNNADVHYHNIVGNAENESILLRLTLGSEVGDGVVSVESARSFDAESVIEVAAEHQEVHQHPRSILEVRRILMDHLVEVGRVAMKDQFVIPTGFDRLPGADPNVKHIDEANNGKPFRWKLLR